jgi:sugar/nucleoside kinase (ribokinase family)/DNA-binding CsgD family transcriptional regulator
MRCCARPCAGSGPVRRTHPFRETKGLYPCRVAALTRREQEIVDLLRHDPLLDAAVLAERLGTTKAAVAVHLSNLAKKGVILGRGYIVRPERHSVVVVGGTNMDIRARSRERVMPATSNPGVVTTSPGGVGRNIAENLARLGTPTHLVSPIGRDAFGEEVLAHSRAAGVLLDHVIRTDEPTGTYLAVMDPDGELVLAVSDMAATDRLSVRQLVGCRDLIANSSLLVLDGNVPAAAMSWLLGYAQATGVPVAVDPVSVVKARHLAQTLAPSRPVMVLTPNRDELAAIVGHSLPNTAAGLARAAREVHALGVTHVWVRRGPRGSLLSSQDDSGHVAVTSFTAPRVSAVDVTGAGDAMTAAFVHAMLRDEGTAKAARFGHMAGALTVVSPETVRSDLSVQLLAQALDAQESA